MEFHHDIYELLIRLFRRKNAPLEKCLALLWQCKRLGHALCVAPMVEAIITIMSERRGELSKSTPMNQLQSHAAHLMST